VRRSKGRGLRCCAKLYGQQEGVVETPQVSDNPAEVVATSAMRAEMEDQSVEPLHGGTACQSASRARCEAVQRVHISARLLICARVGPLCRHEGSGPKMVQ
jgi:hypothetical protein